MTVPSIFSHFKKDSTEFVSLLKTLSVIEIQIYKYVLEMLKANPVYKDANLHDLLCAEILTEHFGKREPTPLLEVICFQITDTVVHSRHHNLKDLNALGQSYSIYISDALNHHLSNFNESDLRVRFAHLTEELQPMGIAIESLGFVEKEAFKIKIILTNTIQVQGNP